MHTASHNIVMLTHISICTYTLTHIRTFTYSLTCHMSSFNFPKSKKKLSEPAIHLPSVFHYARTIGLLLNLHQDVQEKCEEHPCSAMQNFLESSWGTSVRNSGRSLVRHLKMTHLLGSFHLLKATKKSLPAPLAKVSLPDGTWHTGKGETRSLQCWVKSSRGGFAFRYLCPSLAPWPRLCLLPCPKVLSSPFFLSSHV